MIEFELNGKTVSTDSPADTPLLWVIRDELKQKGTKFGCGIAMCGACTVHIDGEANRSCVLPVSGVAGRKVTTIEGLDSPQGKALQEAWVSAQVPQCGYCQSGMQMAAAALLEKNPQPTDDDIDRAMSNVCRCGCYERIRLAIHRSARRL